MQPLKRVKKIDRPPETRKETHQHRESKQPTIQVLSQAFTWTEEEDAERACQQPLCL